VGCASRTPDNPPDVGPDLPNVHHFERRVFELTNIERELHGLHPLIWDYTLWTAARDHSLDMEGNNIFGHTGSDGTTPRQRIERAGITWATGWSENVARGQIRPEDVVAAWMNSPGHRDNILRVTSTHMGVGYIERRPGGLAISPTYWTQKFVRIP